jgi:hypothetical protein
MKKVLTVTILLSLVVTLNVCAQGTDKSQEENEMEETKMRISIEANGKATLFELNNSNAAKDIDVQLPMSIGVENYSNNEKIFYSPKKLDTANTPPARGGAGTLAYYAPWGDVVLFYGSFGQSNGLYGLGQVIQGGEHIRGMSGTIRISKAE